MENLLLAWLEFRRGKSQKSDVQEFEHNLEDNLVAINQELRSRKYEPDSYASFYVRDPKLRHIHKPSVRDRVIHQAVFRIVYSIFDGSFIHDSYACRFKKGTHAGVDRLGQLARKVSKNYNRHSYVLKCDIIRFFASVDQIILFELIKDKVRDHNVLHLIRKILESFSTKRNRGLPLGNVTSQLFANIYLNELDQFVKHKLRVKYYLRYCDDFLIMDREESYLRSLIPVLSNFLDWRLGLSLHPEKVSIRKFSQGVDFLGYVTLPHYRVLRTKTKQRMFRKLSHFQEPTNTCQMRREKLEKSLDSYLGMLSHAKSYKIVRKLKSQFPGK